MTERVPSANIPRRSYYNERENIDAVRQSLNMKQESEFQYAYMRNQHM